jgi:hypothetical protein
MKTQKHTLTFTIYFFVLFCFLLFVFFSSTLQSTNSKQTKQKLHYTLKITKTAPKKILELLGTFL